MEKEHDLFLFLGQSNMAGRGVTSLNGPSPRLRSRPEPGMNTGLFPIRGGCIRRASLLASMKTIRTASANPE